MILLAVETATPTGGVALLRDGAVVGEMRVTNAQAHSRRCLEYAEALLDIHGVKWSQVDVFAASHGPGAFVGVRVGLTLIKGLAWNLGKPCVTVSSLEALAVSSYGGEAVDHVVPVIDARVGEVYTAIFRLVRGRLERESEDLCLAPEELARRLAGRCVFSGEGARKYRDVLAPHGDLAPPARLLPTAAAVAELAARDAADGKLIAPADVAAVYLRDAIAHPPRNATP